MPRAAAAAVQAIAECQAEDPGLALGTVHGGLHARRLVTTSPSVNDTGPDRLRRELAHLLADSGRGCGRDRVIACQGRPGPSPLPAAEACAGAATPPSNTDNVIHGHSVSRLSGLHPGLRRGEALAVQWSDVDLERHPLRVRGTLSRIDGTLVVTEPRTAKSKRGVPISSPAEHLLRAVHAAQDAERRRAGAAWRETGFVFTTEFGEPCDPRNAFRALRGGDEGRPAEGGAAHAAPLGGQRAAHRRRAAEGGLRHPRPQLDRHHRRHPRPRLPPDVARQAMDLLGDALDR